MEILEQVFNKLSPVAFTVSLAILKSREEAEDAVQEIFLNKIPGILHKNPNIPMEELSRLLVVTTRNYSIDVYRRRKKMVSLDDERQKRNPNQSSHVENELDLKRIMEQLEPRYREVLTLKYVWGLTWQEVSEKIGLSVQGVRKRADKALAFFRNRYGSKNETEERE
jgi:RNA polymerase sigma-70 factor (ECF subfamily)